MEGKRAFVRVREGGGDGKDGGKEEGRVCARLQETIKRVMRGWCCYTIHVTGLA